MDADFLKSLINTIVFLLPVLGLVWKGAALTTEFKSLKKDVQEKTEKFCRDHREMQTRIENERLATDSSVASIMATLTEIQKSLVRVETKLDMEEEKKQ